MIDHQPFSVLTHDGVFHADEVLAIALLEVFSDGTAVVTRGRGLKSDNFLFVIDVNGEYSPEHGLFDHHQFEKDHEKYGKSSAGLIWEYIQQQTGVTSELYKSIAQLVKEVDEQDTGVKKHEANHFCNIIAAYNSDFIYKPNQEMQFYKAVNTAHEHISNLKRQDERRQEELLTAENAHIEEFDGVRVAILEDADRWVPSVLFIDRADLVVQQTVEDGVPLYVINTVALARGSFDTKYTLDEVTHPDIVFTHKAGFISKVHASDEELVLIGEPNLFKKSVICFIDGKEFRIPVGKSFRL